MSGMWAVGLPRSPGPAKAWEATPGPTPGFLLPF